MTSNQSVTAHFTEIPPGQHTLTMAVSGSGSTNPSVGTHTYDEGASVTISATPASGWAFDHWSGSLAGTVNPRSIAMISNQSVTAHFVSTGSGPTTPTPTPSPTPTHTPSPTHPATPPEDAGHGWYDPFESAAIDARWAIENELPGSWDYEPSESVLRLYTEHLVDDLWPSLFLSDPPAGDFTMETKVKIDPNEELQRAGLIVYSETEMLTLSRLYCSASRVGCVGDGVYFAHRRGGAPVGNSFATRTSAGEWIWLRLSREGGTYTGYYSTDGDRWVYVGKYDYSASGEQVGIFATTSWDRGGRIPADFDYVSVDSDS